MRIACRDAEFVVGPCVGKTDELNPRIGVEINQACAGLSATRAKTPMPLSSDPFTFRTCCSAMAQMPLSPRNVAGCVAASGLAKETAFEA